MLKNFTFSPNSGNFCADTSNTVSVQARDMTDAIKTNYLGTVNLVWTVVGGTCSSPNPLPATLNYAAGDAGQRPLSLNCAAGTTVSLAATDSIIAGTVSTSGSYVFAACAPSSFEIVQVNAASNNNPLYTQRTSTAFNLELRALDSSRNILTSYTGTVSIGLVDATTYPTTNPCASLPTLSSSTNYVFSAADLGKKTISFNQPNPARNVRVRATDSTYAVTSCSSDNFAIRPDYFTISPATSIDVPASDILAAGNDFTLTATPVYHNGGSPTSLTSGYDGTPAIVVGSIKDHNNAAIVTSALSPTSFPAASGGAVTGTFKYHDVGTIAFDANAVLDSLFTQVDQVVGQQTVNGITIDHGSGGDCVNAETLVQRVAYSPVGGLIGCTIGSGATSAFGRFIPAYFDTAAPLTCPATFAYSLQPLTVTVKAMSKDGVLTRGYSASPGLAKAVTLTEGSGASVAVTNDSIAAASFVAGEATVTVPAYKFTTVPTVPTNIVVRATESTGGDGVTSNVSVASFPLHVEAGLALRSGRMRMSNAFGSEKLPLSVPLALEYYTVGGYWAPNIADNCTQLLTTPSGTATSAYPPTAYASNTASNACFGVCTNASTADTSGQAADYGGSLLVANPSGTMTATASVPTYPAVSAPRTDSTTFYQGGMSLSMGAPLVSGTYLTGSLGLTLVSPPWLQVGGANPTAKVSFGIYNQLGNSNKIIYRREVR
jgi:MSHA biogenesis protein MshQ